MVSKVLCNAICSFRARVAKTARLVSIVCASVCGLLRCPDMFVEYFNSYGDDVESLCRDLQPQMASVSCLD